MPSVDVQAGSGGTEAQDWAEMLLRMYLKLGRGERLFEAELIEASPGEVAGIKSATVQIRWRAITRSAGCEPRSACIAWCASRRSIPAIAVIRRSPPCLSRPRSTTTSRIEINPADLRIDVYRASGAGGQHVNRTESAVRITHNADQSVVQCQNDRSQHKNKATAMKQLRAKLYELEQQETPGAESQAVEDTKSDIGWGSQIRSYVLDQSRIKDLRTGVETGNTEAVLNGDLNRFIEESLKQGL